MIEISAEALERVEKILSGIPKGAERAVSNSINRGLSRIKTGATKGVRQVYFVQNSALTSATHITINRAGTGNLVGSVNFAGVKIPLYKFSVTPKVPGTGQRVFGALERGGGATFEDAFIATMSSGHTGVFEREGNNRFPIKEIMGLSAAQMVANTKVMEPLEEEAKALVNERLEHEIDRLLNGYGA